MDKVQKLSSNQCILSVVNIQVRWLVFMCEVSVSDRAEGHVTGSYEYSAVAFYARLPS
jgi:hypothetical protein